MAKFTAKDKDRLRREQGRLYNRFRPFFGEIFDAGVEAEASARVDALRGGLESMMQRTLELERRSGIHFPIAFANWSVRHLTSEQLDELEARISDYRDLASLFDACGLPPEALGYEAETLVP